ncbi:TraL conjugative transposon family protein [Bacteroidales bacterium OttesenSCG-928-J19]|nr:TraL conjugative transposon family protein [Bacteroidales bacterium OttesenSCG-928-J19]
MIKKKLIAFRDWLEDRLKSLLGEISPDGRITVIIIMLFLFAGGSIYMTVSSIYNMGRKSGQQEIQIEHVKGLELEYKQETDSIKQLNKFNYE